jgi:hypothetical protein
VRTEVEAEAEGQSTKETGGILGEARDQVRRYCCVSMDDVSRLDSLARKLHTMNRGSTQKLRWRDLLSELLVTGLGLFESKKQQLNFTKALGERYDYFLRRNDARRVNAVFESLRAARTRLPHMDKVHGALIRLALHTAEADEDLTSKLASLLLPLTEPGVSTDALAQRHIGTTTQICSGAHITQEQLEQLEQLEFDLRPLLRQVVSPPVLIRAALTFWLPGITPLTPEVEKAIRVEHERSRRPKSRRYVDGVTLVQVPLVITLAKVELLNQLISDIGFMNGREVSRSTLVRTALASWLLVTKSLTTEVVEAIRAELGRVLTKRKHGNTAPLASIAVHDNKAA